MPEHAYSWTLLRAGRFRLDGGGMFGVIPRAVWTRAARPDDRNRIEVQHNCVLLTSAGHDAAGPILLEAGTGNKADDKMRDIFGLEDRWVGDALAEAGSRCQDIRHVIISHLHFDHAGGLTRRLLPGESPAHPAHPVALSFPNAEVIVQRQEWIDAARNNSVMTRTYFPDHLEPVEPTLRLIDTVHPYPGGEHPARDQEPALPLEQRCTQVLPGVHVFRVPGHTWGQQATLFRDDRGRAVVFTPDILPTAAHIGAAYSLAYDVEPYVSMVCRAWFLREACRRDWLLILDHEPGNPLVRVRDNGKGWYTLEPEP